MCGEVGGADRNQVGADAAQAFSGSGLVGVGMGLVVEQGQQWRMSPSGGVQVGFAVDEASGDGMGGVEGQHGFLPSMRWCRGSGGLPWPGLAWPADARTAGQAWAVARRLGARVSG